MIRVQRKAEWKVSPKTTYHYIYLHPLPTYRRGPSLVTFRLSESRESFRCWIVTFFPWNTSGVNFWMLLVMVINWKKAECLKASTNALRSSFHFDASAKTILLRSRIQKCAPHTHKTVKWKDLPESLEEKTKKKKHKQSSNWTSVGSWWEDRIFSSSFSSSIFNSTCPRQHLA